MASGYVVGVVLASARSTVIPRCRSSASARPRSLLTRRRDPNVTPGGVLTPGSMPRTDTMRSRVEVLRRDGGHREGEVDDLSHGGGSRFQGGQVRCHAPFDPSPVDPFQSPPGILDRLCGHLQMRCDLHA